MTNLPHTRGARFRLIVAAFVTSLLLGATLGLLPGCSKNPAAPEATNPWDPDSPVGGDPLMARATIRLGDIQVTWNQPAGYGITRYEIARNDNPTTGWGDPFGFVEHIEGAPTNSVIFEDPDPTTTHWFRVQAKDALGNFSLTAYATPGSIGLGPRVAIAEADLGIIPTRFPGVTLAVTRGDSITVALDSLFTESVVTIPAPAAGDTTIVYDLGPRTQGDKFRLHTRAFSPAFASDTTRVPLTVDFEPAFTVAGNPATVANRLVDLAVPATGVVRMRFADSEAALAGAAWVDGDTLYPDYLLADTANPQKIWGEFEGDFGFSTGALDLDVQPDLLTTADFAIETDVSGIVGNRTAVAVSRAEATGMRFGETPDFTLVPWIPYEERTPVTLSGGQGEKIVYGQYRNEFAQSGVLADTFFYVPTDLSVKIVFPAADSLVVGGRPLLVRGTSAGTVAAPVTRVEFEGGDGIWRDVVGTDAWETTWDVPSYLADTPVTIRARAWTADDFAVDAITVTVTQLAVRIDEPLDGAQVEGDSEVTIAGRAISVSNGAPIDSVVVDVSGEVEPARLVAGDTDDWSVTWSTQTVTTILDAVITARVWAAGEFSQDQISVTVAPPPAP